MSASRVFFSFFLLLKEWSTKEFTKKGRNIHATPGGHPPVSSEHNPFAHPKMQSQSRDKNCLNCRKSPLQETVFKQRSAEMTE
jgi:hypothetical protein